MTFLSIEEDRLSPVRYSLWRWRVANIASLAANLFNIIDEKLFCFSPHLYD